MLRWHLQRFSRSTDVTGCCSKDKMPGERVFCTEKCSEMAMGCVSFVLSVLVLLRMQPVASLDCFGS